MNDRGVSFTFGPYNVSEFLTRHDLDLVCRAPVPIRLLTLVILCFVMSTEKILNTTVVNL